MDLALSNLKWLTCHKTKPLKQITEDQMQPNYPTPENHSLHTGMLIKTNHIIQISNMIKAQFLAALYMEQPESPTSIHL